MLFSFWKSMHTVSRRKHLAGKLFESLVDFSRIALNFQCTVQVSAMFRSLHISRMISSKFQGLILAAAQWHLHILCYHLPPSFGVGIILLTPNPPLRRPSRSRPMASCKTPRFRRCHPLTARGQGFPLVKGDAPAIRGRSISPPEVLTNNDGKETTTV